jgi:hypothetical protein
MRKYLASLVFAGGAFAASHAAAKSVAEPGAEANANAAAAVEQARVPPAARRDEAAMVLVGTALIGLAAVVRRAA